LPSGIHFVSASGADATSTGSDLDLRIGSLFAGDERRIIVELSADEVGSSSQIKTIASWNRVGQSTSTIDVPALTVLASSDPADVERGRDGSVLASATSVLASKRQLEAAQAYASGDVARATQLTTQNEAALTAAAS